MVVVTRVYMSQSGQVVSRDGYPGGEIREIVEIMPKKKSKEYECLCQWDTKDTLFQTHWPRIV